MTQVIQHLYLIPMFISAILSLKAFRLSSFAPYKLFSILLFTALTTEILANLWHYYLHDFNGWSYSKNNAWIYTISFIPQYVLFMLVYHRALQSTRIKKVIVYTAVLFTLLVLINVLFIQKFYIINSNIHILADCIMLFLAFAYFEELRRDKVIYKLSDQPMVWISLGSLVFHLLNIPFLLSINYLNRHFPAAAISFFYVYLLFIFVSYVLYSRAFLCKTPPQI